jgi:Arc/MetJ-type ribon-helix-helix transcriptional regulator
MQISLTKPDLARFVEDQVKTGHYPTPEAVVEAAIADLRDATDAGLDEKTIAAINRAEDQLDRGDGLDFDEFAAAIRKKMAAQ